MSTKKNSQGGGKKKASLFQSVDVVGRTVEEWAKLSKESLTIIFNSHNRVVKGLSKMQMAQALYLINFTSITLMDKALALSQIVTIQNLVLKNIILKQARGKT